MSRPYNVKDALKYAADDLCVGEYEAHVLYSAYQPIYRLSECGIGAAEAFEGLVRVFKNDDPVDVGQFFTSVVGADRLFIECMCQAVHIRNYRRAAPKDRKLFVNINPAAYDSIAVLEREYKFLLQQFEKNGLKQSNVVFELLETEPFSCDILKWLRDMARENGIRFAMDDFGADRSNIERYVNFRPEIVKIDMNYFHLCIKHPSLRRKLKAHMDRFQSDGVVTIVEGIETHAHLAIARELGADMVQGYLLHKPQMLPADFDATGWRLPQAAVA